MSVVPIELPTQGPVLVAGAGGGFDFVCGLPIVLELESRGYEVHIANYSFSYLAKVEGATWLGDHLLEVGADASLSEGDYFPEVHLSRWYRERGKEKSVWCIAKRGVKPTLDAYDRLVDKFGIETVFCVDGGVDGIFRGDEHDLGTPSMDSISLIAASRCNAPHKIYATTAFGIEGTESGVCHAQVLMRMADLIRENSMLGAGAILPTQDSGRDFVKAAEFIFRSMGPRGKSNIVASIIAAMRGTCGHKAVTDKMAGRLPWISPLTLLVWYFDARAVAKMKLFHDEVLHSETVMEVAEAIAKVRELGTVLPQEEIPL